jgi:hypothetical protein
MPSYCLIYHYGVDFFLPSQQKRKNIPPCGLCAYPVAPGDGTGVPSEAGGEKHPFTHPQSNAGIITIAEV